MKALSDEGFPHLLGYYNLLTMLHIRVILFVSLLPTGAQLES